MRRALVLLVLCGCRSTPHDEPLRQAQPLHAPVADCAGVTLAVARDAAGLAVAGTFTNGGAAPVTLVLPGAGSGPRTQVVSYDETGALLETPPRAEDCEGNPTPDPSDRITLAPGAARTFDWGDAPKPTPKQVFRYENDRAGTTPCVLEATVVTR